MEMIRHWLNGTRNYGQGVQLYLQFGKDDILRSLFKKEGETAFKKGRLMQALKELLQNEKKSFTQIIEQPATLKITEEKNGWEKAEGNVILLSLKGEWQKCFSEMKLLQHRLADMPSKEERGAAAHRILDLDDQCDEYYAQRDYYLEHGKLPDEPSEEIVTDPTKWPMKLANARRYIREYRIKMKKEPENIKYAAKLKQYEEEVVLYEEKLKIHAD